MLLRQACWSHCNLLLRQAHFNLDLHNRETMTLANCLCSKKFLKCTMFSMRNYNKQQRWHYQLNLTYKHTQSCKETGRLWHVWPACHQNKLGPGRLIELKYTLWNVDSSHYFHQSLKFPSSFSPLFQVGLESLQNVRVTDVGHSSTKSLPEIDFGNFAHCIALEYQNSQKPVTLCKNTVWKIHFGKIQFGKYSLGKYILDKYILDKYRSSHVAKWKCVRMLRGYKQIFLENALFCRACNLNI